MGAGGRTDRGSRWGRFGACAVLLGGLVVGAGGVEAATCASGAAVAAQAATPFCGQPYEAERTQEDVVYRSAVDAEGETVDLALDVWEPVGDPATVDRPVVLWMHGGYFSFGSRQSDEDVFRDFASRGFVVVTISYRLRPVPPGDFAVPSEGAVQDALDDAVAAVAWIHDHAAELRIDRSAVVASGYSAGGITALGLAHKPTPVTAPGSTTPIAAAVSFSGMDLWGDPPTPAPEPPVLMYNSDDDTVVPLPAAANGCRNHVLVGSECDLVELHGRGHTAGSPAERQQVVAWLAAHGIEQLSACDRFDPPPVDYSTTTTTTTTTAPSTTTTTTPGSRPPAVGGGGATPAVPIPGSAAYAG